MTSSKGDWKNTGSGIQLYLLIALWFLGIILGASVSQLILGEASYETAANIRLSNSISSIFLFLIPASVYGLLFADGRGEFLTRENLNLRNLIFALIAIFTIQPFVETIAHYNAIVQLPQSMSGLNDFFIKAREFSVKSIDLLFADKSITSLLLNILVIAIIPGVVEELFFRGCMQRAMLRISKNIHIAVWATAIIFSLFHLDWIGFFPRIVLGAFLGYIYLWTKNIWVPILAHIANNMAVVVLQQMFSHTSIYKTLDAIDYSLGGSIWITLISIGTTTLLLYFIYKAKPKEKIQI